MSDGITQRVHDALRGASTKLTTHEIMDLVGEPHRQRINNAITLLRGKNLIEKEEDSSGKALWWLRDKVEYGINGEVSDTFTIEEVDGKDIIEPPKVVKRRSPGNFLKIDIDDLRKILGKAEADNVLSLIHAATVAPLKVDSLLKSIDFVNGVPLNASVTRTIPVFKSYFRISPGARRTFISWARETISNGGIPK